MSYKLKTLVVFDTNSLRSTEAGEVAYSFFAFGRPFQAVEEFILENKLDRDVHFAIPSWVLEELKDQKLIQYNKDFQEFKKVAKRLSGMLHIQEEVRLATEFDCVSYIQTKATEFLATKDLKIIEISEVLAHTVLQNMMKRVLKDENIKHPFVHATKSGKLYKDAGFKDNLIWESLLHYQELENYDKVIFFTADSDYANCKAEFLDKWSVHFSILSDENNIIAEIQTDYENYIRERVMYEYAQTDYFRDYLTEELKKQSKVFLQNTPFLIESFEVLDTCTNVERMPPNEDLEENVIIYSDIEIIFSYNTEKKAQVVIAKTTLADDESKEIIETTFDPELI